MYIEAYSDIKASANDVSQPSRQECHLQDELEGEFKPLLQPADNQLHNICHFCGYTRRRRVPLSPGRHPPFPAPSPDPSPTVQTASSSTHCLQHCPDTLAAWWPGGHSGSPGGHICSSQRGWPFVHVQEPQGFRICHVSPSCDDGAAVITQASNPMLLHDRHFFFSYNN